MTDQLNLKTPRRERHFTYVPPVYLSKLNQKYGSAKVADLIGISSATINEALRDNEVNRPYEVAARGIWIEEQGTIKEKVAILCAPEKVMETVQMIVQSMGGKFTVIP